MDIRFVISTALCAAFFNGIAAAEQATDTAKRDSVVGFGSGTGMGPGGGAGSPASIVGGFNSVVSDSGGGSQTFGGGFNRQENAGSGPLSYSPSTGFSGGTGSSTGTGSPAGPGFTTGTGSSPGTGSPTSPGFSTGTGSSTGVGSPTLTNPYAPR